MTDALDGNAAAGALADIFISEMTVARATCAKCGDTRRIGELRAYLRAPGIVLRCPTCHTAEVRIVRAEASAWLDLRGIRVLQLDVPANRIRGGGVLRMSPLFSHPMWPGKGRMPDLAGATAWLGSAPLTRAELDSNVVLVQFGTFTCINWLRTLPHVPRGRTRTAGTDCASSACRRRSSRSSTTSTACVAPYTSCTSSTRSRSTTTTRSGTHSRTSSGPRCTSPTRRAASVTSTSVKVATKRPSARSRCCFVIPVRRICLGFRRRSTHGESSCRPTGEVCGHPRRTSASHGRVASRRPAAGSPTKRAITPFRSAFRSTNGRWAGIWTRGAEAAVGNDVGGRIAFRFHARDLHLILAPPTVAADVRFRVRLDGQPPQSARGCDVDEDGDGVVSHVRLHQLIRQEQVVDDRHFEIEFFDQGVAALCFTFG